MQSILQYRAFGQQAQRQYERETLHKPNTALQAPEHSDTSSATAQPVLEPPKDINNDVEKGPPVADTASERMSQETQLGPTLIGIEVVDDPGRGQVFVVGYEGPDDALNPHNWSHAYRLWATVLIASIAFIVGWASSIDSGALQQAADELHVGQVAESLATGIYLIGFGVGSLFAGPFSETFGRNIVYIVTM